MGSKVQTEDSQVISLLCSHLTQGQSDVERLKPLSATEWSQLADRIAESGWESPGALLGRSAAEIHESLTLDQGLAERVAALLDRGVQFAVELERLRSRGIWILTRADDAYPAKLEERLKHRAPPVLFGAGPVELLSEHGVAVVGSRDVDEQGQEFAKEIGSRCATEHLTVFSGAARGVDRLTTMACLDHSGFAVGVLADSLERVLLDPSVRKNVLDEHLALVTPFHPSSPFSVGSAMGRNDLIYCLSERAVVVASSLEKGGTWHGALKNLKKGWVPLFVRDGPDVPKGNRRLIEMGASSLEIQLLRSDASLRDRLWQKATKQVQQGTLF